MHERTLSGTAPSSGAQSLMQNLVHGASLMQGSQTGEAQQILLWSRSTLSIGSDRPSIVTVFAGQQKACMHASVDWADTRKQGKVLRLSDELGDEKQPGTPVSTLSRQQEQAH